MNRFFLVSWLLINILFGLQAQELPETVVKSDISAVTVFLKGAQIIRSKAVNLQSGEQVLKIAQLSPFIDAKSIQVKVPEGTIILGVNFKKDYLEASAVPSEIKELQEAIDKIQDSLTLENIRIQILNKQLAFLDNNQKVSGDTGLQTQVLEQVAAYRERSMTQWHAELYDIRLKMEKMNERKAFLANELETLSNQKRYPSGEILVKVTTDKPISGTIELNYLVENAGWFPSYDLRANDITKPMEVVYKANVFQDTKVDWKDVKLSFSSANPSISGVTPDLKPYFLDYYSKPPVYNLFENKIEGIVTDEYGEPLIGANIIVKGTNIGTVTDFEGAFSLQLPNDAKELEITYVGYQNKIIPIKEPFAHIILNEEAVLEEVVIVSYGGADAEYAAPNRKAKEKVAAKVKPSTPPVQKAAKATSLSFVLDRPYTLVSSNKSVTVAMEVLEIPVAYQHFSIPKIQEKVFLKAFMPQWEQYQLMEGEANIFLEGTYIGKTLLDTRYASDTLEVSLGEDKSITIKREKAKNFKSRRFIGTNQTTALHWDINIKNNKNRPIQMLIFDQVPVSQNKDIEVEVLEKSNASFNKTTGIMRWEIQVPGQRNETLRLQYEVKYPKGRSLQLE